LDKVTQGDEKKSKKTLSKIIEGPSEQDLVYSGLEDVMCEAVVETKRTSQEKGVSLRLAAFTNAIKRIYDSMKLTL